MVDEFRRAAASAIAAGFDGVELHGANGYLIHQFLSSNANQRTDGYGGTIANRIRLAVEVATAVAGEIGADRTGLRLSPANPYNDITENDTPDLDTGLADVITVGTTALANPDLVARLQAGVPLNESHPATFYGGDHRGYTDYPTLATAEH